MSEKEISQQIEPCTFERIYSMFTLAWLLHVWLWHRSVLVFLATFQGFSSGNWEEALAFQIGNFMRDNCSFWEDRVFKSFWNRVFFIVHKY